MWELSFISLRKEYQHKLFGIFFCRFVSPPPFIYLFNHLPVSVWTHGYSSYTVGCNPVLQNLTCCTNCFCFGHGCSSLLVTLISLWHIPIVLFFETPPLTFWHYKIFQAHSVHFLPQSQSQTPLQGAGFFDWRIILETKTWVLHGFFYFWYWFQFCKEGID